jgi:hypothetical protein
MVPAGLWQGPPEPVSSPRHRSEDAGMVPAGGSRREPVPCHAAAMAVQNEGTLYLTRTFHGSFNV